MRIDIITLFPEMLEGFFSCSILERAQKKGFLDIHLINIRDYAINSYGQVDDYAYGGGAGMVIRCEPLVNCIESLTSLRHYDQTIYLTPDGKTLNQHIANSLSLYENLIFLCGHYKGIDERVREHFITMEISIGDYVLSGGEIAAAVLADSVVRLIPGVLTDEQSALTDSFQDGLLAPAVYTRPSEFRSWKVPEVLLSGDAKKIEEWQEQNALERTKLRRKDLLSDFLSNE